MEKKKELSGEEMMAFCGAIYNRRFKGCGVNRDDMIMEGVLGIMQYQERYDGELGQFSTYVGKCAYGRMLTYYKKQVAERSRCEGLVDGLELEDERSGGELDGDGLASRLKTLSGYKKSRGVHRGILDEMMANCRQKDVAANFNVTKQYVSRVWKKFCCDVQAKYEYIGGELVLKEGANGSEREL